MVSILYPNNLRDLWPQLEPLIQKFLASEPNHEYTAEDLLREGLEGKRDFWIVFGVSFEIQALLSTYITSTPQKKIWFGHVLVGDNLHDWFGDVMEVWSRWALAANCDAMQAVVKRGMGRMLERYGWQMLSMIVEKPLGKKEEHVRQ